MLGFFYSQEKKQGESTHRTTSRGVSHKETQTNTAFKCLNRGYFQGKLGGLQSAGTASRPRQSGPANPCPSQEFFKAKRNVLVTDLDTQKWVKQTWEVSRSFISLSPDSTPLLPGRLRGCSTCRPVTAETGSHCQRCVTAGCFHHRTVAFVLSVCWVGHTSSKGLPYFFF